MTGQVNPGRRVYRGIWAVLAGLFKVPEKPPNLLAIGEETVESFRPSPGFLDYLRLQFFLVLFLVAAGLFVAWAAIMGGNALAGLLLAPLFLFAVVAGAALGWIALQLRYDTTWYVLSGRSLRIRRGIWIIREATATFENVQNVELKQGPLQRHFGIANLIVQTAGGGGASQQKGQTNPHEAVIEGVVDAAQIRDAIMARVRRSRRSGLGDERPDEAPEGHGAEPWSRAHVEALRAIRDEVVRLRRRAT